MSSESSATRLAQRAEALVAQIFARTIVPLYFRADLTLDEQIRQRGKPLPYLMVLSCLVSEFGLRTIVEIGSARMPMRHALTSFDPVCCNDGHSTYHLAATGAELFTVDIDPACASHLAPLSRERANLHVATADGIAYLKAFDGAIDVLFLDAWDVAPGTGYAEKHLGAYRAALPKLAPRCVVQIDDTDLVNGGKGRLVIPQMIRDGFDLVTWGRQAILVRD